MRYSYPKLAETREDADIGLSRCKYGRTKGSSRRETARMRVSSLCGFSLSEVFGQSNLSLALVGHSTCTPKTVKVVMRPGCGGFRPGRGSSDSIFHLSWRKIAQLCAYANGCILRRHRVRTSAGPLCSCPGHTPGTSRPKGLSYHRTFSNAEETHFQSNPAIRAIRQSDIRQSDDRQPDN